MSKGYTISYFVNVFSSASTRQLDSVPAVYKTLSPRYRGLAVKSRALNTWLGGNTNAIVLGTGRFATFGATPRARLLKALRMRKQNGKV